MSAKLTLCPLEDRSLMASAIAATLTSGGVLLVAGTEAADRIAIYQDGGQIWVDGVARSFPAVAVKAVIVTAGGGNDGVTLNGLTAWNGVRQAVAVPSVLAGGEGDDVLVGGDRGDVVVGEGGYDLLYGWNGNDVMIGGAGFDAAAGGAGTDQFFDGYGYLSDGVAGEVWSLGDPPTSALFAPFAGILPGSSRYSSTTGLSPVTQATDYLVSLYAGLMGGLGSTVNGYYNNSSAQIIYDYYNTGRLPDTGQLQTSVSNNPAYFDAQYRTFV